MKSRREGLLTARAEKMLVAFTAFARTGKLNAAGLLIAGSILMVRPFFQ